RGHRQHQLRELPRRRRHLRRRRNEKRLLRSRQAHRRQPRQRRLRRRRHHRPHHQRHPHRRAHEVTVTRHSRPRGHLLGWLIVCGSVTACKKTTWTLEEMRREFSDQGIELSPETSKPPCPHPASPDSRSITL